MPLPVAPRSNNEDDKNTTSSNFHHGSSAIEAEEESMGLPLLDDLDFSEELPEESLPVKEKVTNNSPKEIRRKHSERVSSNNVPTTRPARKTAPKEAIEDSQDNVTLSKSKSTNNQNQKLTQEEINDGWAIDEKTGAKYKPLPKTEWNRNNPGYSTIHIPEEMDASYDLNTLADTFLPHLRVAPSKEEIQRMRAQREEALRAKEEAWKQQNAQVLAAEEAEDRRLEKIRSGEIDPFAKKPRKNAKKTDDNDKKKGKGLFGRK